MKIHAAFPPDEALAILSIPRGEWVGEDNQIWHYENNGIFSVRSGYRLAQSEDLAGIPSSSSSSMIGWWKGLWNLSVPSKILIFMWRLCLNRLHNGDNLLFRNIDVPSFCSNCGRSGESVVHVFWFCKVARKEWLMSNFGYLWHSVSGGPLVPFLHILQEIQESIRWAKFEEVAVFLWTLWNNRNLWKFQGKEVFSPAGSWALDYLRSFQATQESLKLSRLVGCMASSASWSPPREGSFKINVDASFFFLGIILRQVGSLSVIIRERSSSRQRRSLGLLHL